MTNYELVRNKVIENIIDELYSLAWEDGKMGLNRRHELNERFYKEVIDSIHAVACEIHDVQIADKNGNCPLCETVEVLPLYPTCECPPHFNMPNAVRCDRCNKVLPNA
jgi:hypothetical protein